VFCALLRRETKAMKKIEAIIKLFKLDEVKEALQGGARGAARSVSGTISCWTRLRGSPCRGLKGPLISRRRSASTRWNAKLAEKQTAQKSDVTLNGHRIAITAPACSRPPR
jgi:hypothetical protein